MYRELKNERDQGGEPWAEGYDHRNQDTQTGYGEYEGGTEVDLRASGFTIDAPDQRPGMRA